MLPEPLEFTLVSWATASTLSENADWSVGTVWGVHEAKFYLLEFLRDRLETPDLRREIGATHRRFRADATIVEDAGIGRAIVQDLRRTSGACMPISIKPLYEKLARGKRGR